MSNDTGHDDSTPLVRIVRGQPTAEELGVVVTVLAVAAVEAGAAAEGDTGSDFSPWSRPALMHRHPIAEIGPGAWQRSLR